MGKNRAWEAMKTLESKGLITKVEGRKGERKTNLYVANQLSRKEDNTSSLLSRKEDRQLSRKEDDDLSLKGDTKDTPLRKPPIKDIAEAASPSADDQSSLPLNDTPKTENRKKADPRLKEFTDTWSATSLPSLSPFVLSSLQVRLPRTLPSKQTRDRLRKRVLPTYQ